MTRRLLAPADVCAIVTTFRPDGQLRDRIERLLPQVGLVVIVDDSGSPTHARALDAAFACFARLVVVHHAENHGVAAALNTGARTARDAGFRWLLTMDDDTLVHRDLVEVLVDAWRRHDVVGRPPVATLGAGHASGPWNAERALDRSAPCQEKRGIITSGSLVPVEVLDELGGFREDFVIDSVDYDFCLRARARGWRVLLLREVGMGHRLGNRTVARVGPWRVATTNHSALRRYYAVRNSLVLASEHARRDPAYAAAVVWFHVKTACLVACLEDGRGPKLLAMLAGVADALRRRLGPRAVSPAGRVVERP